jgi:hypothetical protein
MRVEFDADGRNIHRAEAEPRRERAHRRQQPSRHHTDDDAGIAQRGDDFDRIGDEAVYVPAAERLDRLAGGLDEREAAAVHLLQCDIASHRGGGKRRDGRAAWACQLIDALDGGKRGVAVEDDAAVPNWRRAHAREMREAPCTVTCSGEIVGGAVFESVSRQRKSTTRAAR